MQKRNAVKRLIPIFLGLAVLFCLNSCVSLISGTSSNYLSLLNDDYDVAFQIPVKQNKEFFFEVLSNLTELSPKEIKLLINHTEIIYGNLVFQDNENIQFRALIKGNFPNFVKKEFESYNSESLLKVGFVSNNLVLVTNTDLDLFYDYFCDNLFTGIKNEFDFLTDASLTETVFHVKDAQKLLDLSKNTLISFGISRASLKIKTDKQNDLKSEIFVELKDSRVARTASFIFKKIFPESNIHIVSEKVLKLTDIKDVYNEIFSVLLNLLGGKYE